MVFFKNFKNELNQMAFYKYALEKTMGKKVKSTTFIFPEEFNKNLELTFSNDEVQAVVDKFKNAVKNIENHNFEPTPNKSKENCKYCQYKDFCDLEVI